MSDTPLNSPLSWVENVAGGAQGCVRAENDKEVAGEAQVRKHVIVLLKLLHT